MRKHITFINITMSGLIALSVYGIFMGYYDEKKIKWVFIFLMLYGVRMITKEILKVGFSEYFLKFEMLTVRGKFLCFLQGGLSIPMYFAPLIIVINNLLYENSVIFLMLLAIVTITVDVYSFFRKNEMFIERQFNETLYD